jgi:hypothetical protein
MHGSQLPKQLPGVDLLRMAVATGISGQHNRAPRLSRVSQASNTGTLPPPVNLRFLVLARTVLLIHDDLGEVRGRLALRVHARAGGMPDLSGLDVRDAASAWCMCS